MQLFEGQLGATLHSAAEFRNDLYLVSSSADRIDIVDIEARTRVGQITDGLSNPRHLAFTGFFNRRAYVSNHGDGGPSYVLPIDLSTLEMGTPILVDGRPESFAVPFDQLGQPPKAYVALGALGPGDGGVDSLAVLDTEADTLLRYVEIGCYAGSVLANAEEVLAFCENTDEAVVVSAETDEVVQRIAFGEDIGTPYGLGQGVGPGDPIEYAIRRSTPRSLTVLVVTVSGLAEVGRDEQTGEYRIERTIPIPDLATRPISAVSQTYYGSIVLGRPDPDDPFSADGTITTHDSESGELYDTYPAGVFPIHVVLDEAYPLAAGDEPEAGGLALALAGPNPARHRTTLLLTLDRPAELQIDLFDGLGRRVGTITSGARSAGEHRIGLDVSGLPAGAYAARATADGRTASLPITVAR